MSTEATKALQAVAGGEPLLVAGPPYWGRHALVAHAIEGAKIRPLAIVDVSADLSSDGPNLLYRLTERLLASRGERLSHHTGLSLLLSQAENLLGAHFRGAEGTTMLVVDDLQRASPADRNQLFQLVRLVATRFPALRITLINEGKIPVLNEDTAPIPELKELAQHLYYYTDIKKVECKLLPVEAIQKLAADWKTPWNQEDIASIVKLTGGIAGLVKVALEEGARRQLSGQELSQRTREDPGIFEKIVKNLSNELRRRRIPGSGPLANEWHEVLSGQPESASPASLKMFNAFGLLKESSKGPVVTCDLYQWWVR